MSPPGPGGGAWLGSGAERPSCACRPSPSCPLRGTQVRPRPRHLSEPGPRRRHGEGGLFQTQKPEALGVGAWGLLRSLALGKCPTLFQTLCLPWEAGVPYRPLTEAGSGMGGQSP